MKHSTGALFGGALCLAILGGMIVGHAWPLWTGEKIRMHVEAAFSHDARRGEHVRLQLRENRLYLGDRPEAAPPDVLAIRVVDQLWPEGTADRERYGALRGRTVYLQLEADPYGVFRGVSVSREPVAGMKNLRGLVTGAYSGVFTVHYGIESLFVEQGKAAEVARALLEAKGGEVEFALAPSGRARALALTAGQRRW